MSLAGPVWMGSLGPEGCRTCLKMEALMLKENRHNPEWCFSFWSPPCALSSLLYHWLCGFSFIQFIETNHSHFPWKQLLYFHSCSLTRPVRRRPQAHTQSPRPRVEISIFLYLLTQPTGFDLMFFSTLEQWFTNENDPLWILPNALLQFNVST